ncbi:KaiC domain-containing protein [Halobellus salinus]|uniref:KaiC domain-containing protein n=1 Tax=Halobellus salinus TaxID=931585 RepID=A0A830EAX0_9EURY|nr:KaiC domain-containing protein [Halobellus salinus]GGJ07959.1 KaiC domain-containing protein [Halobellus salinus]
MSDDDDWFERALREDDEAGPESAADSSDSETDTAEEAAAGEDDAHDTDSAGRGTHGEGGIVRDEGDTAAADHDGGGEDNVSDGTTHSDGDDGDSQFEQDFESAFENAPDPDVGRSPTGGGGRGGGSDPFGGGSGEETGSPFGSGNDEFGFGGVGGEEPASFDRDGEFESDLDRLDIGIGGLDQMILGGVPEQSLMVAIGSAGTGKTTFGLQFLHHGLTQGEDAVYITLEEGYDRIVATADEKGWGFGEYADDDRLAIIDIDPIEMANSLDSIQNDLPDLIEAFGADRLVLDSVSLLEMMYESAPKRRSQVFEFARSLKEAGVTTLLTSEADRDHAYASRFGIVEYLADAVFVLQYVRPSDFRETRLAIEIQKIRDANHSRETKPYDLTNEGISVYRQANIF